MQVAIDGPGRIGKNRGPQHRAQKRPQDNEAAGSEYEQQDAGEDNPSVLAAYQHAPNKARILARSPTPISLRVRVRRQCALSGKAGLPQPAEFTALATLPRASSR